MDAPAATQPRARQGSVVLVAVAAVITATAFPAWIGSVTGWGRAETIFRPLVAAALLAAGLVRRRSGYAPLFGVLGAATGGFWVITVVLTAAEQTLGRWPLAVQMVVVNGAKIVPVGLVVGAIWLYVRDVRGADLRVGSWRARSGLRLGGRDVTWDQVGAVVAAALVVAIVASGGAYSPAGVHAALVWLPVYGAAAVVNSAAEEFLFRHSINAATRALLGPAARIALTSVYFGLSHINGTPSGPSGVLLAGAFGVLLGWAIECTRGYGWNWVLHGVADFTIFATLIAAAA